MRRLRLVIGLGVLGSGALVRADSVAQVATSKFLTDETIDALDCRVDEIDNVDCNDCTSSDPEFCQEDMTPDGGTSGGGNTRSPIRPGDVLTFRITFTPVPNGRIYGGGGYITEYVPPGTEVVGVRMVDRNGNTVPPRRAGPMASGWGPRGDKNWSTVDPTFEEGSIAQVYCDTGIFYSTDARTAQNPADDYISVDNGILLVEDPTGAGQFNDLIGATLFHAHNAWDVDQAYAFGTNQADNGGTGNTPHRYGSAVAGPDTWYGFEASPGAVATDPLLNGTVGPWNRIAYPGSETCTGTAATEAGISARVGVPTTAGRDVSPDAPLPRETTAVRYAIGELIVGEEYFAEVSLRVVEVPIHGTLGNVNCAEVFGGDASFPEVATGGTGKDNVWRYFLPAPTCANIDVFLGKIVDKTLALGGDTLTYTIRVINLTTEPQTDVVITDLIDTANGANYVSATGDATVGPPTLNGNVLTWPTIPTLAPGEEHEFTVVVEAGNTVTLNQAFYNSTTISNLRAVAFTLTQGIALIHQSKTATPREVAPGGTVRYTITIQNDGTIDAANGEVHETLPAGWTVTPGTTTVNGAAAADPTLVGTDYVFDGLPNVTVGGTLTLAFDVLVPASTTPGVYKNTFLSAFGATETKTFDTARVGVGVTFSDAPSITPPIFGGETTVTGTSTEGDGTDIRVLVNGIQRGTTTVTGGAWTVTGIPGMFVGQRVTAFAKAPGEEESDESAPVVVEASPSGGTGGNNPDGGMGDGDGGTGANGGDDGCGCHLGRPSAPVSGALVAFVLVALVVFGRRRQ